VKTALALVAITVYAGPYVGEPLFCGGVYDEMTAPWVAMPDAFWEKGGTCGQQVGMMINGQVYVYTVLDRIAPGDWYVIQPDGAWLPIAADLPAMYAPFEGLSTVGRVWNVTLLREELARRAGM